MAILPQLPWMGNNKWLDSRPKIMDHAPMDQAERALKEAITAAGTQAELARQIGTYRQVVNNWRKVPVSWVLKVEQATGVPRSKLRPDIYPD